MLRLIVNRTKQDIFSVNGDYIIRCIFNKRYMIIIITVLKFFISVKVVKVIKKRSAYKYFLRGG